MSEQTQPKKAKTREERIEALKAKKAKLEARLSDLQNAKSKEERKRDLKRKVLIGACVLEKMARGEIKEAELKTWMDAFLVRPYERELFGLVSKD